MVDGCMHVLVNGSSSNGVMCTEESTVGTLKLLIPPWRGGRARVWPLVLGASRMSHYNINLLKGGSCVPLCFRIPRIIP